MTIKMRNLLMICVINSLLLAGCTEQTLVKRTKFFLGTIVEITVAKDNQPRAVIECAIDKAFAEIERVEELLSRFKHESDINCINTYASFEPTEVNPETIRLIEKSIEFSQLTDGAFDITISPLLQAWGFKQNNRQHAPEHSMLKEALQKVGYQHIEISKKRREVFLGQKGMCLDLGGIAKGYAVDRAITILKKEGINRALVNVGGDIYALGKPSARKKWRIAVHHPRKRNSFLTSLELQDQAIATSGDYENYIVIEGKKYSHIINPKSGMPCENIPASVTVLAEDCLSADALATSIFVLGPKEGIGLIENLDNTEAIIASADEGRLEIMLSGGLKDLRVNNE